MKLHELTKSLYKLVTPDAAQVSGVVTLLERVKTFFEQDEQLADINSPEFKKWFKNSKIVDEHGKPLVVYHQTSKSNEKSIQTSGVFNLLKGRARLSDNTVPDGFFFKPTDKDIGVGGVSEDEIAQMPFYLSSQNPLIVKDRKHLQQVWMSIDKDDLGFKYYLALKGGKEIDKEHKALSDTYWEELKKQDRGDTKALDKFKKDNDGNQKIWNKKVNDNAKEARELINKIVQVLNYDGVIIENDEGSFGRRTKTFIVFDPNQIKSVYNNGEFNPNSDNIYEEESVLDEVKTFFEQEEKIVLNPDNQKVKKAEDLIKQKQYKVLFHSGDASIDKDLQQGIDPQFGDWVEEVLQGATDDEDLIERIREDTATVFLSEKPDWVIAKASRVIGKHGSEMTLDDIRRHGQLCICLVEPDADYVFKAGKYGEGATSISGDNTMSEVPFGVESNDIFSLEAIVPELTLTGDDLIAFLVRNYPDSFQDDIIIPDDVGLPRDQMTLFTEIKTFFESKLSGDDVIDRTSTGASFYDEVLRGTKKKIYTGSKFGYVPIKWSIEEVTPYEYFKMSADTREDKFATVSKEMRMINKDVAQKYADKMEAGEKFPLPVIDYPGGSQEGRHRAFAAQLIGVDTIPVLVITNADDKVYANTDSPEFKNWFRGSVTKDSKGDPEIFFHGSNTEFDTFSRQNTAIGFYFTPYKSAARNYGDVVYPVYLRITRLADLDKPGDYERIAEEALADDVFVSVDFTDENFQKLIDELNKYKIKEPEKYSDRVDDFIKEYEKGNFKNVKDVIQYVRDNYLPIYGMDVEYAFNAISEEEDAHNIYGADEFFTKYQNRFMEAAKELGYDGVKFKDPSVKVSGWSSPVSYVVFNPNQIKSIENNGGFSTMSDNIYELNTFREKLEYLTEARYSEDTLRKMYVDSAKVSVHNFNLLKDIDPTKGKKYFEWLLRVFTKTYGEKYKSIVFSNHDIVEPLTKAMEKFYAAAEKNIIKGSEKDINSYKSFDDMIEKMEELNIQVKVNKPTINYSGLTKGKDYDIIEENENGALIRLLTFDAAQHLTPDSYCIHKDPAYWYDYVNKDYGVYLLLDYTNWNSKTEKITGMAVSPSRSLLYAEEVNNGLNQGMSQGELQYKLEELGIDASDVYCDYEDYSYEERDKAMLYNSEMLEEVFTNSLNDGYFSIDYFEAYQNLTTGKDAIKLVVKELRNPDVDAVEFIVEQRDSEGYINDALADLVEDRVPDYAVDWIDHLINYPDYTFSQYLLSLLIDDQVIYELGDAVLNSEVMINSLKSNNQLADFMEEGLERGYYLNAGQVPEKLMQAVYEDPRAVNFIIDYYLKQHSNGTEALFEDFPDILKHVKFTEGKGADLIQRTFSDSKRKLESELNLILGIVEFAKDTQYRPKEYYPAMHKILDSFAKKMLDKQQPFSDFTREKLTRTKEQIGDILKADSVLAQYFCEKYSDEFKENSVGDNFAAIYSKYVYAMLQTIRASADVEGQLHMFDIHRLKQQLLETVQLEEASLSRVYKHWLDTTKGQQSYALVTSQRDKVHYPELSRQEWAQEQNRRYAEMLQQLKHWGLSWIKVAGVSEEAYEENGVKKKMKVTEPSVFVIGITWDQILELARKYEQDAFIYAGPESKFEHWMVKTKTGKSEMTFKDFSGGKISRYYSEVKGRPFYFK